jgi:hypothetical protein
MKKTLPLLLILSLLVMSFPVTAFAAEAVDDPYEAYLRLGAAKPDFEQLAGGLQVWNDAETLYVEFVADEPYCISALHLQIGNDLSDTPQVQGMTLPGPAINESYDDCLPVRGPFEFDLSDNGWDDGSYLVIAAHADIGELVCTVDCVTIAPAPYGAFQVIDYEQGLRKDGTAVLEIRSNPDSVLIWDSEMLPDAFFSLGLGGWIEVEFDKPIANGDGDDVLLVEDTWGPYVSETAEVYASNDGVNWIPLGEANNEVRDPVYWWQTVSSFDLGTMTDARFIRVEDTTPVETMPPDGDGYDLNSIQALQDYEECTETCEECYVGRAWAGNKVDPGADWSRWVRYTVVLDEVLLPVLPAPAVGTDEVNSVPDQANGGAAIQQAQKGR